MPAFAPVTLSGLAALSGVDVESILRYHALGLLPEPRRSRGRSGNLAYHAEHLERLSFIRRAIEVGFELSAVRELVGLSSRLVTCGDVYAVASRQLERLHAEPARLPSSESELAAFAARCTRRGSGKDCPILAGLRAPPPPAPGSGSLGAGRVETEASRERRALPLKVDPGSA